MRTKQIMTNYKEHYKMYKSGKQWIFASLAVFSIGAFAATTQNVAHAASNQAVVESTTQSQAASNSQSQSNTDSQSSASTQSSLSTANSGSVNAAGLGAGAAQNDSQSTSNSNSTSTTNSTSTATSTSSSTTVPANSDTDRSGVVNTNVPSSNSKTSVTVNVPDQVQNPDKYKTHPVDVSTYSQFVQAWNDPTVDYINLTQNITNDTTNPNSSGLLNRPSSTGSVIINGNGYTLDLAGDQLKMGTLGNSSQNATLTLTNIHLENGYSDSNTNNSIAEAFLYTDDGSHLTINVNNVTLSASQKTGYDPAKFIYTGVNSAIVFSGTNVINNTNEIARGASNIQFANNSNFTLQRTKNDFGNAAFWMFSSSAGNTGYGNSITIGDGATLDMEHYSNYSGSGNNVCLIYEGSYLSIITAGDNVSWTQKGFRGFFWSIYGSSTGQFVFGQNFNLNIASTDATASITLIRMNGSQSMVFNAGAQINIQTNHASDAIFWLEGSSTVNIISPKSIHFARLNPDGTPGNPTTNFLYGVGPITITNGTMKVWNG